MLEVCFRKQKAMKQIILFTLTAFLSISVFAQPGIINIAKQNSAIHEKKEETPQVKIYPNPCKNNKVNVEFKSHLISEVQLINIVGKVVLLKNYDFMEMKKEIRLDGIQNGMYLLKVKSTDNKVVVKKFIISRQ